MKNPEAELKRGAGANPRNGWYDYGLRRTCTKSSSNCAYPISLPPPSHLLLRHLQSLDALSVRHMIVFPLPGRYPRSICAVQVNGLNRRDCRAIGSDCEDYFWALREPPIVFNAGQRIFNIEIRQPAERHTEGEIHSWRYLNRSDELIPSGKIE